MKKLVFISICLLLICSSFQKKKRKNSSAIPVCIQNMIKKYAKEEKQNPPKSIYSYQYNGQTVYYVTPPCCDFFSELFDSNCKLMGNPDGGFSGKGDGKFPDFHQKKTNEKLVWEDQRK